MTRTPDDEVTFRAYNVQICRASAQAWRGEAECLRALAARPGLAAVIAEAHLRSAASADEQADWWEAGLAADLSPWEASPIQPVCRLSGQPASLPAAPLGWVPPSVRPPQGALRARPMAGFGLPSRTLDGSPSPLPRPSRGGPERKSREEMDGTPRHGTNRFRGAPLPFDSNPWLPHRPRNVGSDASGRDARARSRTPGEHHG